jgi:FkbM family methyltransferase
MHIQSFIQRFVPRNGIVIEAGSWNGDDTLFFARHCTEGKVFSFEPFPSFFYQSAKKLYGWPNVELAPLALAEKTQPYTLFVSEIDGNFWCSNSILKPKDHLVVNPHVKFEKEVQVQGINLDDWFQMKGLDHIDMMWLDIQGAEPAVLKAAPNILSRTKFIYTEVSLVELYEGTPVYTEFKKFMESKGFEVMEESLPSADSGDVLFRNTAYEI